MYIQLNLMMSYSDVSPCFDQLKPGVLNNAKYVIYTMCTFSCQANSVIYLFHMTGGALPNMSAGSITAMSSWSYSIGPVDYHIETGRYIGDIRWVGLHCYIIMHMSLSGEIVRDVEIELARIIMTLFLCTACCSPSSVLDPAN